MVWGRERRRGIEATLEMVRRPRPFGPAGSRGVVRGVDSTTVCVGGSDRQVVVLLLCVADRPGGAGLDFEGTEGLQEAIATIDAIAWNATVFCF